MAGYEFLRGADDDDGWEDDDTLLLLPRQLFWRRLTPKPTPSKPEIFVLSSRLNWSPPPPTKPMLISLFEAFLRAVR